MEVLDQKPATGRTTTTAAERMIAPARVAISNCSYDFLTIASFVVC
jgi:hypothetical protein